MTIRRQYLVLAILTVMFLLVIHWLWMPGTRPLRAQGATITYTGYSAGPVLPGSCSPLSLTQNPFFYLNTQVGNLSPGIYTCGPGGVFTPASDPVAVSFVNVTADFTTINNTSLQAITGLTWTMPASVALNLPYYCHLAYSQATANAAVAFGIQDVTVAPTNIMSTGHEQTNVTAFTEANLPTLASTTATAIVSATPSAITTIWEADLNGFIEQPSNASSSAITILASTAAGADAVTVKRGSFCRVN